MDIMDEKEKQQEDGKMEVEKMLDLCEKYSDFEAKIDRSLDHINNLFSDALNHYNLILQGASEELFKRFTDAGFAVGARMVYRNSKDEEVLFTVTGIYNAGFIVEFESGGKTKRDYISLPCRIAAIDRFKLVEENGK